MIGTCSYRPVFLVLTKDAIHTALLETHFGSLFSYYQKIVIVLSNFVSGQCPDFFCNFPRPITDKSYLVLTNILHKVSILLGLLILCNGKLVAQIPDADQTEAARKLLFQERIKARTVRGQTAAQILDRMIELGMWGRADRAFSRKEVLADPAFRESHIRFRLLTHNYQMADSLLEGLAKVAGKERISKLFRIELKMISWELAEAEKYCIELLKENERDEEAVILLGKINLLNKRYDKALALAEQVQQWSPENARAFLLAAEAYLWKRDLEKAEKSLKNCLKLNPFLADARFYYGYTIWRRVDASQLGAMAAQWELALEINPLHYLTHWHWGNGHTHLTYEDYIDRQEAEILDQLSEADRLLSQGKINEAIAFCKELIPRYPASVLPEMLMGSAWYMAYEPDHALRLDSALSVFSHILLDKKHYGPAHNGLAAVIKMKQMQYLSMFDSLEEQIEQVQITDRAGFFNVFSDLKYYPGDRVAKMVWSQLFSSVAYFPFLSRLEREFVIPPLHHDLARAMKNPYFRGATTFDNRQWMDIRGVGSGATGIEYVERGAHLERNVTLHEYVHLVSRQYIFGPRNEAGARAILSGYGGRPNSGLLCG